MRAIDEEEREESCATYVLLDPSAEPLGGLGDVGDGVAHHVRAGEDQALLALERLVAQLLGGLIGLVLERDPRHGDGG